jgi:F0F1-type ATP synthase membrane subunit b/b'
VSPALANFLFEAVNFLLLAAALGWVLFKPVRAALDAERERRERTDAESQRLHAEASALAEQARAGRQALDQELDAKRRQALDAARAEAAALLEAARTAQRAEAQALREELRAVRDAEAAALAQRVGRLSGDAVRRLLEALEGPALDLALVRAACAELEALPIEARRGARIESARPLDAEALTLLRSVLGADLVERVVPELGAGVRVTTPAGQVDATALAFARRAAATVSSATVPEAAPTDAATPTRVETSARHG